MRAALEAKAGQPSFCSALYGNYDGLLSFLEPRGVGRALSFASGRHSDAKCANQGEEGRLPGTVWKSPGAGSVSAAAGCRHSDKVLRNVLSMTACLMWAFILQQALTKKARSHTRLRVHPFSPCGRRQALLSQSDSKVLGLTLTIPV